MPYDRTKPYNDLPLLPQKEPIHTNVEVLNKLVIASRALSAANSSLHRLPNPYMLINTIALQEAKESAAIENIFTTEDELYLAASDTIQEDKANLATKEVLHYREALWKGYTLMQESNQVDSASVLGIFREVKNTAHGFRSPASQVVIKRGQSEFRPGSVVYTPPRGEGIVEKLLENLFDYMNDDEAYPIDPLLKMCVAHYQFEAIHPFPDGNGRTGRILNLLYLVNKGLIDKPVLYLSKYIIKHKDGYYHYLAQVTQTGNWKGWLLYMLSAIEETAKLTSYLIDSINSQMEATLAHAKPKIKWYNKEVNELLFSQPYLKPKLVGDKLNITSRTTLTRYFKELVAVGVLSERKIGRDVFYINDDLLRIMNLE